MKKTEITSVNEWNQDAPIPTTPELAATELENSFGSLNTPEPVSDAHGRMTDRASRISLLPPIPEA